nr:probable pectin methylesterase CGR2 [Ziziphus jujuba var. spinosa]
MHKILHVGPDTCSVVSKLLKEKETEASGVEPYDIEDADRNCKAIVKKGIMPVADIKFPLPYRPKSFSLVIVLDALEYLSPRYLNKTLLDLARVSIDGLVIFTGEKIVQLLNRFCEGTEALPCILFVNCISMWLSVAALYALFSLSL